MITCSISEITIHCHQCHTEEKEGKLEDFYFY